MNCIWSNQIYYTIALLLLAWSNRVVIFVAYEQLISTFVGMKVVSVDVS